MKIVFDRKDDRLWLLSRAVCSSFPAANNAARSSNGPWPDGIYRAEKMIAVPAGEGGGVDEAFGPWFLRFVVSGRTGMGIHAGRRNFPDGLQRRGHLHATRGCIRTIVEAMSCIEGLWRLDGSAELWVTGG